jgi:hypothetical protein
MADYGHFYPEINYGALHARIEMAFDKVLKAQCILIGDETFRDLKRDLFPRKVLIGLRIPIPIDLYNIIHT